MANSARLEGRSERGEEMPSRGHYGLGTATGIKSSDWLESEPCNQLTGSLSTGIESVYISEGISMRRILALNV